MKNKTLFHKLPSFLLCLALFSLLLGITTWALGNSYLFRHDIAPGTAYYRELGSAGGANQNAHYIEYSPNSAVSPIVAYGSKLYGRSTITTISDYLEDLGYPVVAGLNADFYDLSTGIPVGLVMRDGSIVCSGGGYWAVGFYEDGRAVIGKPVTYYTLSGSLTPVPVASLNKGIGRSGLYLLDTNYSGQTLVSSGATQIVFERLDDLPIKPNGSVALRVVSRGSVTTSTPIAANQMVLLVSDNGPVETFPGYAVGETVYLQTSTSDRAWDNVLFAVGGKKLLQGGSYDAADNPTGAHPRSAVGIKSDGTVILYEVDGRQSGISAGLTPAELASELKGLGCLDALNLDGGGSSALIVRQPPDTKPKVVSIPSDGSLRPNANYIMLVKRGASPGGFNYLHVYPKYYFALPGAQVALEALATDSNYNPSNAPGAYTFSSDSKGTISGNIFTAGTQTGLAEVSVTWGGISGRQNIAIIQGITNIRLSKKGENTALTGLNLDRDATLDLQAAATYRGNEVAASNELFQWQVTGNIGEISPDGRFIANGPGSSGSISASYNGVKAQVNINLAGAYQIESRLIADFEQNQPFAGSSGWQLSRTRLADQVKSGRYALKAEYDFNQASDLNLTAPADAGTGKYFHFWLMGDASAFSLSAKFTDSQGEIIYVPVDTRGAPKTYQCLQAEVPAGAVNFTGFSLSKGNAAQGVFYLDQIFFSDQSPADSNPPGLTFLNPPAQAANGQNIQFSVKAQDESPLTTDAILVWLDGKKMPFQYNGDILNFSSSDWGPGLHRATVEAFDCAGNGARTSVNLQGEGQATGVFADMESNWATEYVNFVNQRGLLKGEAGSGGILNFQPNRNLTRAEFAAIICRYLGLAEVEAGELPFVDRAKIPAWARGAVATVYREGIMGGSLNASGQPEFRAEAAISRQEVMTVLSRCLPRGYKTAAGNFKDQAQIATWAAAHVDYLVSLGIVGGYPDGTIAPTKLITRAEAAKILYGMF